MSTEQTELRDRVHEVIYNHRAVYDNVPEECVCACNRTRMQNADHRAHVAQAIIDDLGLTVHTMKLGGLVSEGAPFTMKTVLGRWEKQ